VITLPILKMPQKRTAENMLAIELQQQKPICMFSIIVWYRFYLKLPCLRRAEKYSTAYSLGSDNAK
jgi:hypothetical protein